MNVCKYNSGDEDGFSDGCRVDPHLKHHFLIKSQQAYSMINVCVLVNMLQKEMDMEIDIE